MVNESDKTNYFNIRRDDKMNITIRSEKLQDYFAIAEIHALAFDYSYSMGEVLLVDALRHKKNFDPELSLVAESEGEIVGHVMFNPIQVLIKGIEQKAINLAPVAIHPDYQKQGIGSLLIEEGHRRIIKKGYDFSILLGDPNYYSRFGYQPNMYGTCGIEISRQNIKSSEDIIKSRRVKQEDIPLLMSMWEKIFADTELVIKPGQSIVDWISTSQGVITAILEVSKDDFAYVRYDRQDPTKIMTFLAKDKKTADLALQYLHQLINTTEETLKLPLPPYGEAIKALIPYSYNERVRPWDAGMIKILNQDNQHIHDYCQKVQKDDKAIGLIQWPVEFENC